MRNIVLTMKSILYAAIFTLVLVAMVAGQTSNATVSSSTVTASSTGSHSLHIVDQLINHSRHYSGTTRWFTIAETRNGNSSFLWQSCGLPGVAKLQIFISFISKVFLKCLKKKLKLLVVVYFKSSKFRAISTKISLELELSN
ncbi:uncharacterized protein LOC112567722 [Pomacea canaliculata]|uniref:uncharacterized protein LOC112567722 n=1 Tax=Pomacea canaliculata TaxID=400727 RepID=UPI000D73ACB4|nr:uncharacterized protein LOC112567722 [Pomacea canaliculata]